MQILFHSVDQEYADQIKVQNIQQEVKLNSNEQCISYSKEPMADKSEIEESIDSG